MTRRAILVEASAVKGQKYLAGAVVDPQLYSAYLRSDAGGAWRDDEVEILNNPSPSDVRTALKRASAVDYAFVTFSGHGYHAVSGRVDETRVMLQGGELAAHDLNPGNPRCSVVIDACRQLTILMEQEKMIRASLRRFSMHGLKTGYRRVFDEAIARCEKGPIYLYSCDLDESAGDTDDGGLFSLHLIKSAEDWFDGNSSWRDALLTIDTAHEHAARLTTGRQPQQHPKIQGGRRNSYFPFGVYIG